MWLDDIITRQRPEIFALMENDLARLNIDPHLYLIQAMYVHYYDIFTQLNLGMQYHILANENEQHYIIEAINISNHGTLTELIVDLFDLGSSDETMADLTRWDQIITASQLERILEEHMVFDIYRKEDQLFTLIESLIMKQRMSTQPTMIFENAFNSYVNDDMRFQTGFKLFKYTLTASQVNNLLHQISRGQSPHWIANEIKSMIWGYYEYMKSL